MQTFHWPNGTAARDNGKREISAGAVREDETGCEQDDRSSDPRFRSAPIKRQDAVGCEFFLTKSAVACPHRAGRLAVPDPARPAPGLRRGHSAGCTKTVASSPIRFAFGAGTRPTVPSFSENAAQVSNEATLGAVTVRRIARQGHQAASSGAVLLDDAQPPRRQHAPRPRRPGRAPVRCRAIDGRKPVSGHRQPSRRRRRRVTRQGRSAKRRTRASGLTRGRRWRSPQPLLPEPQVHLRQPSLGLYTAALTVAAASGVLGTSSRTSSGRR